LSLRQGFGWRASLCPSGYGVAVYRAEARRSRSPTAETRRRDRRQCRCKSCREHHLPFAEAKPQQTGTGLLIRRGEVATTSDSTNFAGSSNRRTSPFEGEDAGANPAPATSSRPVVK